MILSRTRFFRPSYGKGIGAVQYVFDEGHRNNGSNKRTSYVSHVRHKYNTPRLTKGQRRRRRIYKAEQARKYRELEDDKRRKHSGDYMSKLRAQTKLEMQEFVKDKQSLMDFEKDVQDFIRVITQPSPSLKTLLEDEAEVPQNQNQSTLAPDGIQENVNQLANKSLKSGLATSDTDIDVAQTSGDLELEDKTIKALKQELFERVMKLKVTYKSEGVSNDSDRKGVISVPDSSLQTLQSMENCPNDKVLIGVIQLLGRDSENIELETDARKKRYQRSVVRNQITELFDLVKLQFGDTDDGSTKWKLNNSVAASALETLQKTGANIDTALQFMETELIQKHNVFPDAQVVNQILKICIKLNEPERGWKLYNTMLSRFNFTRTSDTYASVLLLAAKSNDTERGISLYHEAFDSQAMEIDHFETPDSEAGILELVEKLKLRRMCYHNAILACSKSIFFSHVADDILQMMLSDESINPDHNTLSLMMSSCARVASVQKAEHTWNHLTLSHGVKPDTHAYNSLMEVYARNQWNSRRQHRSLYRGYDPWSVIQHESGLLEGNPNIVKDEQYYDEVRAVVDQMRLLPDEAFFTGIDKYTDYFALEEDEAKGISAEESLKRMVFSGHDLSPEEYEKEFGSEFKEFDDDDDAHFLEFINQQNESITNSENELSLNISDFDDEFDADNQFSANDDNGGKDSDFEENDLDEEIHILQLINDKEESERQEQLNLVNQDEEKLDSVTSTVKNGESSHSNDEDEDVVKLIQQEDIDIDLIKQEMLQSDNEFEMHNLEESERDEILEWENDNMVREWEDTPVFELPRKTYKKLSTAEKKELAYRHLFTSKHNISTGLMALETMDPVPVVEKRNIAKAEELLQEMDNKGVPVDITTMNSLLRVYAMAFRLDRALGVYNSLIPARNLSPDTYTYAALIQMYVRVNKLDKALDLAEEARKKYGDKILNCETYGCLVDGFARQYKFKKCFETLRVMRRLNYKPFEKHMRMLRIRCVEKRVKPPDGLVPKDPNAWRKPKLIKKALQSVRDSKKRKKLTNWQIHAMQRI